MKRKGDCITALSQAGLFENQGHLSRFKELMDCFSSGSFFSKGLCKCMYLGAWDEEHFCVLLEMLTSLSLGKDQTTVDMKINGENLAQEEPSDDALVYTLSVAFLEDQPFTYDPDAKIDPGVKHIIEQALKASDIIDTVL